MVYHNNVVNLIGPYQMRSTISLLSSILLLLSLNYPASAQSEDVGQPIVVSTIWPLHLIAAEVLGNDGSSKVLIDMNDSAHHFNLMPDDRIAIAEADVLLWIDPIFETQLGSVFDSESASANKPVITASSLPGIKTRVFADQTLDPHLWLDPDNVATIAEALARQLATVAPQHAADYQQRAADLVNGLGQIQTRIEELRDTQSKSFFVYHDAFSYIEERLEIQHIAEFVIDPDAEPSMRHLLDLRQRAAESAASCVLTEPDSSEELVATVFPNQGANLIVIDVLGQDIQPGTGSYTEFLGRLLDSFGACIAPAQ